MQPGYPGQPPRIDNNMAMSVVSLFLFWPLAIPALINASKVTPLLQQGNYAGAQVAADESRKWSKWAIIAGVSWWVLCLVCCGAIVAIGAFTADSANSY